MKFVSVSSELPNYEKRVIVKTVSDHYFTAVLMTDEDGEFWVYDLPSDVIGNGDQVSASVVSWAYPDEG